MKNLPRQNHVESKSRRGGKEEIQELSKRGGHIEVKKREVRLGAR